MTPESAESVDTVNSGSFGPSDTNPTALSSTAQAGQKVINPSSLKSTTGIQGEEVLSQSAFEADSSSSSGPESSGNFAGFNPKKGLTFLCVCYCRA